MLQAIPMIVSEANFKDIYAFEYCSAKALYNAALFRIRQVFTGWDKGDNRTPLEQSVFDEIECAKEAYTNRHSCFLLQYHIVLVTKYRRPVLTGAVKELVYQVIQDIFDEKDLVILEMNGEADHIHILFEADPFTAPVHW